MAILVFVFLDKIRYMKKRTDIQQWNRKYETEIPKNESIVLIACMILCMFVSYLIKFRYHFID